MGDDPYKPPVDGMSVWDAFVICVLAIVCPVILLFMVFTGGRPAGFVEIVLVTFLNGFVVFGLVCMAYFLIG